MSKPSFKANAKWDRKKKNKKANTGLMTKNCSNEKLVKRVQRVKLFDSVVLEQFYGNLQLGKPTKQSDAKTVFKTFGLCYSA